MGDRSRMSVTFDVTEPQAIALRAFFEQWNHLSCIGGSRFVAFYADGDGDFHPYCQITMPMNVCRMNDTEEMRKLASNKETDYLQFDYDPIAWAIDAKREERMAKVRPTTDEQESTDRATP